MNICILGAGMQGRVVARDLAACGHAVTVADIRTENLNQVPKSPRLKTRRFDVRNRAHLIKFIRHFDVVVGALPAALGFYSMECAIRAGVNLVDFSYSSADPFLLNREAKRRQVKIVPDAGFAPGLGNVLIGDARRTLGRIDSIKILAGGIPQKPIPPFNYRIVFSLSDLLEEYTRPARIVKNFKVTSVDPLTGVKELKVTGVGRLECFYTDGLRTLLKTFRNVKNMEEKTIRYPGHAALLTAIIDCGFLSEIPLRLKPGLVRPKEFTNEFLKSAFSGGSEKDLSILLVEIQSKKKIKRYCCIDYYDTRNRITSMARTTGYTASIITQCIHHYPGFGVIPPEFFGMDKNLYRFIKAELQKRRIFITVSTSGRF